MEFPLAQRELTQAGRDRRFYIIRTVLAGAAVIVLLVAWMFRSLTLMATGGATGLTGGAEAMGQALADTALGVQLVVTFLAAPLLSAGLVTTEKEEGTLGLLLLADLSGRDLFLSKYLRAFLLTQLLLLSTLPFVSFAALLGGVSVPDAAARLVLFGCYAAALCAVGLLFSTVAGRAASALFLTMLFTSAWVLLTTAVDVYVLPALGFDNLHVGVIWAMEDYRSLAQGLATVLPQMAIAAAIGLTAAALAIRLLPRQACASDAPRRFVPTARRAVWRRRLRVEPAEHFVFSGSAGFLGHLRPWPLRILALVALTAVAFLPCAGDFIIIALMSYDILSSMYAARRDGAMDELVLTPLPDSALARAIYRANLRAAFFYGVPMLAAALIWSATTTVLMGLTGASSLGAWATQQILHGPWLFGLQLGTLALSVASDVAFILAMTALLSYIGIQRGSPTQQTGLALLASLAISVLVGLPTPFLSTFLVALPSVASGGGSLLMQMPSYQALGAMVGALIEGAGFGGIAILFYYLLTEGVRRHLISQPQIYLPTQAEIRAAS